MESEMEIVFGGGKKIIANFDGMDIPTDQSVANGGEGTAPEPYTLFLASLGTCAGIYIHSFCKNRELSTEGIRIIQRHLPNENGKGIGTIRLEIKVPESFPQKYHKALIRSANLCAVKKTLENPPVIETIVELA